MKKKQHLTRPTGTRLYDDEIAALDTYRRTLENPPTRSETIRNIVRHAVRKYLPAQESEAV